MNSCYPLGLKIGGDTTNHWDLGRLGTQTIWADDQELHKAKTHGSGKDFKSFSEVQAPSGEECLPRSLSRNDDDGILFGAESTSWLEEHKEVLLETYSKQFKLEYICPASLEGPVQKVITSTEEGKYMED